LPRIESVLRQSEFVLLQIKSILPQSKFIFRQTKRVLRQIKFIWRRIKWVFHPHEPGGNPAKAPAEPKASQIRSIRYCCGKQNCSERN